jgi:hypothetical protein
MNASDLKLKLYKQIDTLGEDRLEELYGLIMNFINSKKHPGDWDKLSEEQKKGLFIALDELDAGKGIPHDQVMEKIHKKYRNG